MWEGALHTPKIFNVIADHTLCIYLITGMVFFAKLILMITSVLIGLVQIIFSIVEGLLRGGWCNFFFPVVLSEKNHN